ncbi:hypothetical protein ABIE44_001336 [Marmoricola sp. OAE513]
MTAITPGTTNSAMRSASRITPRAVSSLDFMNERSVYRDTPAGMTDVPSQESGITP